MINNRFNWRVNSNFLIICLNYYSSIIQRLVKGAYGVTTICPSMYRCLGYPFFKDFFGTTWIISLNFDKEGTYDEFNGVLDNASSSLIYSSCSCTLFPPSRLVEKIFVKGRSGFRPHYWYFELGIVIVVSLDFLVFLFFHFSFFSYESENFCQSFLIRL